MNWAIFYSPAAQSDCDGLPGEALAALGELEAQLTQHPFLGDPNPNNQLVYEELIMFTLAVG